MVKKERIPIPKPRTSFLLVQCRNCGNEQTIFSSTTKDIACKVCGSMLAKRTGGKAEISAVIIRRLD